MKDIFKIRKFLFKKMHLNVCKMAAILAWPQCVDRNYPYPEMPVDMKL